jgi:cobalt-zinc-cadmium efflux system outer membrane protein
VAKPLDDAVIAERLRGEPMARLTERAQQLRLPGAVTAVQIDEHGAMNALGAAALAVVAQPNLRAARTRAGIAQAQLTAAGILPNPTLTAGVDVPILGSSGMALGLGLGLSWEITALLTRPSNRQAAQAQVEAVDLEIAWEEWQTAMAAQLSATRLAWLQVRTAAAENDAQLARDFADRLTRAVAQHAATSLDMDAAAAAAENAAQRTVALRGQLDSELLALKRAIGLPHMAQITVTEPTPLTPQAVDAEAAFGAEMPAHRLDLLGLQRAYASQDARVHSAVLSQFPRLALGLNAARDTAGVGTLGPGVAIEVPIFDHGQGRIALETASREQLFEVYLARRAEAQADLAKVLQELAATEQQLAQAAKVLVRLQKLAAALTLALEHRQADAVMVFTVRQQLMDARQNHLALAQLHAELRVALQAVVGQCLPEDR